MVRSVCTPEDGKHNSMKHLNDIASRKQPMKQLYLGLDGGGTKTHCVLYGIEDMDSYLDEDYLAYHDALMKNGPLPFNILQTAVDEYIAAQ